MLGGISETIPMEQFCFSFFGLPGLKLMHSCPILGVFGVLNQLSYSVGQWNDGYFQHEVSGNFIWTRRQGVNQVLQGCSRGGAFA